ncbi:hydrolase [Streptomyces sp. NPDC040750]|uniref:hydrolase n=1 Tax=Streptomyces sp. NPDC040750 TaxID=3154491 RepID=UPI0033F9924F
MQSPYPPRPPYPPLPGPSGESDGDLISRLAGPYVARHHAVAVLLARHWRAARDYAAVCLTSAGPTAHLVATAAFHQVFDRVSGAAVGCALRPRLLVAVRDTVRAWATDEGTCAALPELRKTAGGRGLSATKPGTPERRQLAESAFQALPGGSQCLLWHTEVEAEPINIPAGLLGIDTATATVALERAREQFRSGCVRAHRELAPSTECRLYNRLLDVAMRRGGGNALPPEVRRHLAVCRFCRYAAEQLAPFTDGLELLLAETVLGWGARRYLDIRPGRGPAEERPSANVAGAVAPGLAGRHRVVGEGRRRHRTVVALGVALTSLLLLTTALAVRSWSVDNGVPARPVPGATWVAPAGRAGRPNDSGPGATDSPSAASPSTGSTSGGSSSAASPSAASAPVGTSRTSCGPSSFVASAGGPVGAVRGRLRGPARGLCRDARAVHADRVAPAAGVGVGAGVRLAGCSSAAARQWSHRPNGRRGAAVPTSGFPGPTPGR